MVSRKSERIVIVGGSHGALAVIEALKREGYSGKLTLISEEKVPVFSPTALPYLLWKHETSSQTLRPPEFYRALEVIEERAIAIDPEKSVVILRNGKKVRYDRLVLATGASAARLPIETPKRNPLLTLRRIEDLRRMRLRATRSRRVLVVGAGLVGLHLAQVFSGRGKDVHVVEQSDQILPGLVPPELAERLTSFFRDRSINISLGASLSEVHDQDARLSDGETVQCDLVICAIGIKPNLEMIRGTSLATRVGVLVNEWMETNVPGVYACGDVAEFRDFFTGESRLNPNVISAAEQGRTVAENLMGKKRLHPGLISVNVFNCLGLSLFSLGRIVPEPGDSVCEEYDEERPVFKRMIFKDRALKSVVLFNSPADGGLYYRLLRERVSLCGLEEKMLRDPLLWGKRIGERVFKG